MAGGRSCWRGEWHRELERVCGHDVSAKADSMSALCAKLQRASTTAQTDCSRTALRGCFFGGELIRTET